MDQLPGLRVQHQDGCPFDPHSLHDQYQSPVQHVVQIEAGRKLGGDAIERLDPITFLGQFPQRLGQCLGALLDALLQFQRKPAHLVEQASVLHRHGHLVGQC